jgi:hypothetical protein
MNEKPEIQRSVPLSSLLGRTKWTIEDLNAFTVVRKLGLDKSDLQIALEENRLLKLQVKNLNAQIRLLDDYARLLDDQWYEFVAENIEASGRPN